MCPLSTLEVLDKMDRFRSQVEALYTPEDVYACLTIIEAVKEDNEMAHEMEDELHRKVLGLVASGLDYTSCKIMAEIALKTRDIEFVRWHA